MHYDNKSQSDKFKEAAAALETDDDEARFDERLRKIAKAQIPSVPVPTLEDDGNSSGQD